ncbi:MAG: HPF/RaiA family ribosome-associated protein [Bacteroidaceae bacterium]|nr:HPF/RaiA family ribosome-associated protein [Bacteroidaceae bacterium]
MVTRVQTIHFDASQQLLEFVEKKVSKLERLCEGATSLEVAMKLIKPETAMNKEVSLRLSSGNGDMFASKVCDTFEEALMGAIDALKGQIEKNREKMR